MEQNCRLVLSKAEMILAMLGLVARVLLKEINHIITSLKYGL